MTSEDGILSAAPGLQSLMTDLVLPTKHWTIQNKLSCDVLIYKPSDHSSLVTHCVRIKHDLTWTLSVHGVEVCAQKCDLLICIPKHLCQRSLVNLLNLLDSFKVCPGHPDKIWLKQKKGDLCLRVGKIINAKVDCFSPVFFVVRSTLILFGFRLVRCS